MFLFDDKGVSVNRLRFGRKNLGLLVSEMCYLSVPTHTVPRTGFSCYFFWGENRGWKRPREVKKTPTVPKNCTIFFHGLLVNEENRTLATPPNTKG